MRQGDERHDLSTADVDCRCAAGPGGRGLIAEAAIGLTGSANALAVAGPSSGSYIGGAAGLTRSRLCGPGIAAQSARVPLPRP